MLVLPRWLENLDQVAEAAGDDGIDHGGWLVVEHNLRLPGEGAGDGHGALSACREAGRQRFHHIFGAHDIDQLGNLLLDLLFAEAAALAQRKGHVLAHAEGIEERAVLEDHGDALADGPQPSSSRPTISWPSTRMEPYPA
jgi:hypothetical protein